jgi:hypothetical protein
MHETNADEKKSFALVGDPKSKEVRSYWGSNMQSRGIVGYSK